MIIELERGGGGAISEVSTAITMRLLTVDEDTDF